MFTVICLIAFLNPTGELVKVLEFEEKRFKLNSTAGFYIIKDKSWSSDYELRLPIAACTISFKK